MLLIGLDKYSTVRVVKVNCYNSVHLYLLPQQLKPFLTVLKLPPPPPLKNSTLKPNQH